MLTHKERRFIRHWEEQRRGSRAGYYMLYIFIWFFVAMIFLFFLLNNFVQIQRNNVQKLYGMLIAAAVISIIVTHLSFWQNERKFKKIIRREMDATSTE